MERSVRKVMIISKVKLINIVTSPQLLSSLLLAIGFCFILDRYAPTEQLETMPLFIITTGLTFSMGMSGIMMSALPLSSDKESNMLRVLMVGSVSPLQYILGSIIPSFFLIGLTNAVIGFFWLPDRISILPFLIITSLGTFISLLIGLVIGFYSSNQMVASSMCIPTIFIFALIPILKIISEDFEKYSKYLYTSQVINYLENLFEEKNKALTSDIYIIISSTMILILLICYYGYRKNRFDR
ncbi:hypothetical protein JZO66_08080 [Enterococcus sp. DIV0242_7C1]|uniref:ABC-2 type transporter transmembrane domain-containing protein n=1 Tax=Candidatus Enterococcus dunnyi TaxID=1834192 RepID=A0A200JCB8_9ENTE|nr:MULTISPECIES: hypothetical protein [unclassified Enterococcus]MBO0470501.1 hypothetical protein [Enterococcus sp. DIV0242_7C1]OUZ34844.1 hypothetical protein A5889_000319 [Enterococcus sp. 9D6_DIV0238]